MALGALVVAMVARRDSKRAADAADDSAAAAKASVDLETAREQRHLERSDVEWEFASPDERTVVLRNAGSTTAYRAEVVFTIRGERYVVAHDEVRAGGAVEFDSSEIALQARSQYQAEVAAEGDAGVLYIAYPTIRARARVTWETKLGTPGFRQLGPYPSP